MIGRNYLNGADVQKLQQWNIAVRETAKDFVDLGDNEKDALANARAYLRETDGYKSASQRVKEHARNFGEVEDISENLPTAGKKIDDVIDKLLHDIFARLQGIPAEPLVKMQCAAKIAECEAVQKSAKQELDAATAEMNELKEEMLRVIRGESALPQSVLTEMLRAAEKRVADATERYKAAYESAGDVDALTVQMTKQLGQLQSWSVLYDSAELPVKKMIASELIRRVTVHSDYKMDIQFNISYEQFIGVDGKAKDLSAT
ncbi:MAG: hypothetical protein RR475_09400 [Clostridia bacterium]